jgi:hypothetical protein
MNKIINRLGFPAKVSLPAAISLRAVAGPHTMEEQSTETKGSSPNRWPLLKAVLVAAITWISSESAFALVAAPRLLPTEYMAIRSCNPNTSPFTPSINYDVAPMLDFRPIGTQYELRSPQELDGYGVRIWQNKATRHTGFEFFNPFTFEFWGWEENQQLYEYGLGHRRIRWGWNVEDGEWFTDTGWGGSEWPRKQCGKAVIYKQNYPHGSGYYTNMAQDLWCEWLLANTRGGTKGFEVPIRWDVMSYAYYTHKWDHDPAGGTWRSCWRAYAIQPGATVDITLMDSDVPQNWEVRMDFPSGLYLTPAVQIGWRGLDGANLSLPEWVEGWW